MCERYWHKNQVDRDKGAKLLKGNTGNIHIRLVKTS